MALVLIFFGSIAGMITALSQVFVFGAPVWLGITSYMALSLGLPVLIGVLAWALCAIRRQDPQKDKFGYRKA